MHPLYAISEEVASDVSEISPRPFDETTEMEAAAALLEVVDEAGLDRFLGRLLRKATEASGVNVSPAVLQAVGSHAKNAIRKALPNLVGPAMKALGPLSASAGPMSKAAGQLLGLELEGLSREDQEFEVARRLVRFTGSAARGAARLARSSNPRSAALRGLAGAARRHAPGFLASPNSNRARRYPSPLPRGRDGVTEVHCHCGCGLPAEGTWHREGDALVLDWD